MSEQPKIPEVLIEEALELSGTDLHDLCDATDDAIESGGGFGWVDIPARDVLERFWKGVLVIPDRKLFVGRLDGIIGGTAQLILTPTNNQAQAFSATVTNVFVAPWARGHGIAKKLMLAIEDKARSLDLAVLNLDVRETQTAAIRLYERLGYTKWGTKPHYARVKDEVIAGHYYSKVLNPDLIKNQPTLAE